MSIPAISRDAAEWLQKIQLAKAEEKVAVCEEALNIWPSATEVWLTLLKNTEEPGNLLARCLPISIDPKLYEAYIDHIKKTKPEDLGAAFEYVLGVISYHPDSGTLWKAYIDWLASQPVANEWEETFRRDKVRKAYKKAVTLPVANIEALWRTYGQFENRISRVSARKFIDERSSAYMKARSAYRTYQSLTKGLNLSTMPNTDTSRNDAARWRKYIEWERSNPLELEDAAEVTKRVHFAYTRATQCARWSPQLWFDAGSKDDPEFWEQGAQAMPESHLLAYKLVESHESNGEYEKARSVLIRLTTFLAEHAENSTPGWVELVKCTHRMQGIDAAREIVQQCLKAVSEPTAELYIAAANLEKVALNPELESKIWEFAYQKFGNDNKLFVSKYLDFLFAKHDVVNARSVFEQAMGDVDNINNNKLWDQMLRLEGKHAQESDANLKALQNLEKRYLEKFPGIDEVDLFIQRFGDDAAYLFDLPAETVETSYPMSVDSEQNATSGAQLAGRSGSASASTPGQVSMRLPDGPVSKLLSMLPPPNVYDGPLIDNQLLMQLILSVNT